MKNSRDVPGGFKDIPGAFGAFQEVSRGLIGILVSYKEF